MTALRRLLTKTALGAASCTGMLAILPAAASAQAALRPAGASVMLVATVQPAMQITSTEVVRIDSTAAATIVTERVNVRTNVSHRLVARGATEQGAQLRRTRGAWEPVSPASRAVVGETETVGETSYLVQCRVVTTDTAAARSCGFTFELESTNAALPATSSAAYSALR